MDTDTGFEAILLRLQKVTGTKTDSALADVLNIKPQSVVAAKKRRQIPPGWIVTVAKKYQVSADWLFFGYRKTDVEHMETKSFLRLFKKQGMAPSLIWATMKDYCAYKSDWLSKHYV